MKIFPRYSEIIAACAFVVVFIQSIQAGQDESDFKRRWLVLLKAGISEKRELFFSMADESGDRLTSTPVMRLPTPDLKALELLGTDEWFSILFAEYRTPGWFQRPFAGKFAELYKYLGKSRPTSISLVDQNGVTSHQGLINVFGDLYIATGNSSDFLSADKGTYYYCVTNFARHGKLGALLDDKNGKMELLVFDAYSGKPIRKFSVPGLTEWPANQIAWISDTELVAVLHSRVMPQMKIIKIMGDSARVVKTVRLPGTFMALTNKQGELNLIRSKSKQLLEFSRISLKED